jgi:hypothetical protein
MPTDREPAGRLLAETFYNQIHDGQPIFAGFGSGYGGTRESAIRLLARYITDNLTPGILAAERVRYVALHDDVYRAQGEDPPHLPSNKFRYLGRAGAVRFFALTAEPVPLDEVLEQNAAAIAATEGLTPPQPVYVSGFHAAERRPDGSTRHWLINDGIVRLGGDPAEINRRYVMTADLYSPRRPRKLAVVVGDSVVATTDVPSKETTLQIGPFRVPAGVSEIRLHAEPGPARLTADDARLGSIYLNLRFSPLADFSVSVRPRESQVRQGSPAARDRRG